MIPSISNSALLPLAGRIRVSPLIIIIEYVTLICILFQSDCFMISTVTFCSTVRNRLSSCLIILLYFVLKILFFVSIFVSSWWFLYSYLLLYYLLLFSLHFFSFGLICFLYKFLLQQSVVHQHPIRFKAAMDFFHFKLQIWYRPNRARLSEPASNKLVPSEQQQARAWHYNSNNVRITYSHWTKRTYSMTITHPICPCPSSHGSKQNPHPNRVMAIINGRTPQIDGSSRTGAPLCPLTLGAIDYCRKSNQHYTHTHSVAKPIHSAR